MGEVGLASTNNSYAKEILGFGVGFSIWLKFGLGLPHNSITKRIIVIRCRIFHLVQWLVKLKFQQFKLEGLQGWSKVAKMVGQIQIWTIQTCIGHMVRPGVLVGESLINKWSHKEVLGQGVCMQLMIDMIHINVLGNRFQINL